MLDARKTRMRTLAAALAAAGLAQPALAAPSLPAGGELAAWLAHNTDLPASQIAIVGPDNVYSLEPLGARSATGEALVLVRTEPLAADWGPAHGFQSWDANLLIDCTGRRMRVIRSATYSERNRHGTPSPGAPDPDWMTPKPDDPATQLVSAACDPAYAWPLRTSAATAAPAKAAEAPSEPATPAAKPLQATQTQPTPAAKPPAPAMVETRPAAFFVQIARGPSEDGARRALQKARKSLGPLADGLTDSTEVAQLGRRRRYTSRLQGFPTAAAAEAACSKLAEVGQSCFSRPDAGAAAQSATDPAPKAPPGA